MAVPSKSSLIFSLMKNARSISSTRRSFAVTRVIFNQKVDGGASSSSTASTSFEAPSSPPGDVAGLSERVVISTPEPVGAPGAAKDRGYKNPEYFLYHKDSYFEAEVEMLKYRCPQPTNKKEAK